MTKQIYALSMLLGLMGCATEKCKYLMSGDQDCPSEMYLCKNPKIEDPVASKSMLTVYKDKNRIGFRYSINRYEGWASKKPEYYTYIHSGGGPIYSITSNTDLYLTAIALAEYGDLGGVIEYNVELFKSSGKMTHDKKWKQAGNLEKREKRIFECKLLAFE
ncbi:hypothetical protein N9V24_05310 [Pseudomonadota bacterium]|nr:hypothetical protein [Pseudomonadota bacterium]